MIEEVPHVEYNSRAEWTQCRQDTYISNHTCQRTDGNSRACYRIHVVISPLIHMNRTTDYENYTEAHDYAINHYRLITSCYDDGISPRLELYDLARFFVTLFLTAAVIFILVIPGCLMVYSHYKNQIYQCIYPSTQEEEMVTV